MASEYRLTDPADRERFYQLYLYAFNGQDSEARRRFFNARYAHGWIYGLKNGQQLTSGLYSLPFTVNFHGVAYKMNGIGDVMSAPEDSGHGGAGTLLKAALQEMYDRNVTLSYLAPFSYRYYRRFGYEQVFNHITYTIAHDHVPAYHPQHQGGRVERMSFAAALLSIKPLYAKKAQNLPGGMMREDWWWDYLTLKNRWDAGVYFGEDGQAQGYAVYERSGAEMTVHKLLANTPAAFEQLMAFLLKHGNTFQKLRYESPHSQYAGDWIQEPYAVSAVVTPYMMARIVDLQDFLNRYPFTQDFAPVTIAVEDPVLPVNAGVWQLSRTAGQTTAEKDANAAPELTFTIQQLTKALMGATSLHALLMSGQGTGGLAAAVRLDQALQQATPEFNDYF
ncbi:GNAT family N-acetyltransferase [Lacticaseibacillus camelliae]|uniref:Acetyltransferase n=1 Tax=Lacticaseibacillus camelliae DSM 22697 = JCM 13995 TaxID=1423730 RepID=A0A0R2F9K8_9LACO|nr:GNAT family N-acetyltransferase [Lacticaseibacillus camelliae]KRN21476.1 acetyltransferase [Lacticaseibacillus camelliae DSM 22697 = JCM 13995]